MSVVLANNMELTLENPFYCSGHIVRISIYLHVLLSELCNTISFHIPLFQFYEAYVLCYKYLGSRLHWEHGRCRLEG